MRQFIFLISFLMVASVTIAQDFSRISLLNVNSNEQESVSEVLSTGINVIIFVDVTCPYVDAYQQRISTLGKLLKDQGYQLIFINPHQLKVADANTLPAMRQQAQKYGWERKYYADQEQMLARFLNATKIPEVFILNLKGEKLEILYSGAIDDNPQNQDMVSNSYVKNALSIIKQGKEVKPQKVPAIGCRILKH